MNRKGFSLIELVATIVILGIVASITIFAVSRTFTETKNKTEDVFIKTLEDAINIYANSSDAKTLTFNTEVCTIQKRFGESKISKSNNITLRDVINSEYTPLTTSEIVNPANEEVNCNIGATVSIFRDEEYVYYYRVAKSDLGCLKTTGYITNLPSGCLE